MKRLLALFLLLSIVLSGCVWSISTLPSATLPTTSLQPTTTIIGSPDPVECGGHESDPYTNVNKEAFYANYTPACCYIDAQYRTEHFLLSGMLEVPGQFVTVSDYQPAENGMLLRNTDRLYLDDGNTYVVVDAYGVELFRVYKGAAYITLEEVAAYMFAFGGSNDTLPANYTSKKNTKPANSPWGEYLRLNHSYFSGDTYKYPYEPKLPNISGCGGTAQYYEMDVGTTGTYTGPSYPVKLYNDGNIITRGGARIVYTRQDLNKNGIFEEDEVFLFYTANHYNDFREYLNYFGGWGEIFGNETGGGVLSDKVNCNPTAYVPTGYASFLELKKQG